MSKRLSYLVRFYATVVDSLLPPQKEKQSQDVDTGTYDYYLAPVVSVSIYVSSQKETLSCSGKD